MGRFVTLSYDKLGFVMLLLVNNSQMNVNASSFFRNLENSLTIWKNIESTVVVLTGTEVVTARYGYVRRNENRLHCDFNVD